MTGYNGLIKAAVYLILATFMFGCTTLRPLSLSNRQAVQSELQAGDEVKVTRKDGSAMSFGIDTVTDEGISGDGTLIAWSDMQQIEVRQFSAGKTIGLVAGIAAVGLVAAGGSGSGSSGY
ncbi:MAG TPA: hypothetical protein VGA68_05235 [Woeseiaceae bacterium]|jgi:hypothetical protein